MLPARLLSFQLHITAEVGHSRRKLLASPFEFPTPDLFSDTAPERLPYCHVATNKKSTNSLPVVSSSQGAMRCFNPRLPVHTLPPGWSQRLYFATKTTETVCVIIKFKKNCVTIKPNPPKDTKASLGLIVRGPT
jgi:hypothetical protein